MKLTTINILLFGIGAMLFLGCQKYVEVDPPVTSPEASVVYQKDATAISVLTGLYIGINNSEYAAGTNSISIIAGLSADEFTAYPASGTQRIQAYTNALSSAGTFYWGTFYNHLYTVNTAIQGISASSTLTPSVKQQLIGEAKFIRAYLYFYLVNLWGDVPLLTNPDFTLANKAPRSAQADVYQQIINDLKDAQSALSSDYLLSNLTTVTTERSRPTKWAASALLARVYLYTSKWSDAATQSSSIISNTSLYDTVSLNNVFLKNSKEAIWQIQPTAAGSNTRDASAFILTTAPNGNQPVALSPQILSAFETNDARRQNWVSSFATGGTTYYYPFKYKVYVFNSPLTEYQMILRVGEQYLIRAEAKAQLGDITGAQADLNLIRKRAGLPSSTATDKAGLLAAIAKERQVELFSEWGHRWFDLKRTGSVNSVMAGVTTLKGGTWKAESALYPLPINDITLNPALTQNPGY